MVHTYNFSIFVLHNHLTDKVKSSMHMTVSEIACQNQKNLIKLNKLKKSRAKSIQIKKYPDSNKRIDEQPQHNIGFKDVLYVLKFGPFSGKK